MNKYKVRTDLAMENGEKYEKDNIEIPGVRIRKHYNKVKDVRTTLVKIETEHGARLMEKPIGTYITMEAPLSPSLMKIIIRKSLWNYHAI